MEPEEGPFQERLTAMIRTADVMSILFTRVAQSLIVDFRSEPGKPPIVTTDPIVDSARERLLSFRRLRPELPLPEQLTLAFWMPSVREFETNGALDALLDRCQLQGGEAMRDGAHSAYRRLLKREHQYLRSMVLGVGMETLWERPRD